MGLTLIQWCIYTFNAWMGCRKVAPECVNCYITDTPPFKFRGIKHGPQRVRTAVSTWAQPFAWNRKAKKEGTRPRVFCLSLGDWLDDEVPIEWLADLLELIELTPHLDWLLLTKRPGNWRARVEAVAKLGPSGLAGFWTTGKDMAGNKYVPHNIWIGVSAGADQRAALNIPARIHFLSCEPMLTRNSIDPRYTHEFDWIIFGGESGKEGTARPCEIEWIREGLEFCAAYGISAFVKQLGQHILTTGITGQRERWPDGTQKIDTMQGKWRVILKNDHGGDMEEWPEDLRVREFPTPNHCAP